MVEHTCRAVARRVPVLVGITDTSIRESLRLAEHAAQHGALAVVVAPPYYFPAGQPELAGYLQCIATDAPLPVVLYNMPACTKTPIELDTLAEVMGHPNVVAFKDSGGDLTYFQHARAMMAERCPDKTILIGPEEQLAAAVLMGGHGGVSGGANVFPRLYVRLLEAAEAGNIEDTRALQGQVLAVSRLYRVGRHASSTIKGIKCALSCLAICDDFMAEPMQRFRPDERRRIQSALDAMSDVCA